MIEQLRKQGIAATGRFIETSADMAKEILLREETATPKEKKFLSLVILYGVNMKLGISQKEIPVMPGQMFNAALELTTEYTDRADDLSPVQRAFVESVANLFMILKVHGLLSEAEAAVNAEGVKH